MHVQPVNSLEEIHKNDFLQILAILGLHPEGPLTPVYEDLALTLSQNGTFFFAREKKRSTIMGISTLFLFGAIGIQEGIIRHITVPEQNRGKQVGVHLLQEMERFARRKHLRCLYLLHPLGDERAERVFREHSFMRAETTGLHVKPL